MDNTTTPFEQELFALHLSRRARTILLRYCGSLEEVRQILNTEPNKAAYRWHGFGLLTYLEVCAALSIPYKEDFCAKSCNVITRQTLLKFKKEKLRKRIRRILLDEEKTYKLIALLDDNAL